MHLVSSDHVLGATGGIGTHVFDALRSNGHTVTTYVRNPTRVPASWGEHVNVIVGELSDTTAIEQAVAGADAVVSALGPSMDKKAAGLLLIEGTRNIIDAMHEHGVKRYVGNGTPSVLDPQESGTWQTKLPTFRPKRSCAAPTASSSA